MNFLNYFLTVFISLFLVVDVISNAPIFLSLTQSYEKKERKEMAKKALLIALLVQLLFVVFGNYIFNYLGIKPYSFTIAGGILLAIVGTEMLFGRKTRTEYSENGTTGEEEKREEKENITVVPLAIPLHTGPASILTGMILFNQPEKFNLLGKELFIFKLLFIISTVLVYSVSLLILLKSDLLLKFLRPIGMKVITRIMGLLILALSVQFVINGIREALG
ncbi:MAG: NAAT family transporter [candidate division Zixibacteria bacterium]|nr:NAAT family transporter [candidate division Zixibacteria bacterium]